MKKLKYLAFLISFLLCTTNVYALTRSEIEQRLENMSSEVFLADYPVGSIYMTTNVDENTVEKMSNKYGGEWQVYGVNKVLRGTTGTAGQTAGSDTVVLTSNNLPKHSHSIPHLSGITSSSGSGYTLTYNTTTENNSTSDIQSRGHTHNIPALSGTAASAGAHTHTVSGTAASAGAHTHSYSVGGDGICIDTGSSGAMAYNDGFGNASNSGWYYGWNKNLVTIASAGAHTHKVTGTATQGTTAATGGNHTHTVTTTAKASNDENQNHTHLYTNKYVTEISGVEGHTHSITTTSSTAEKTGSGVAINVTDSYVTVYMFKRTK